MMKLAEDGEHLLCGADLGVLVDQVAEDLPPADREHEATCEHCQAALAQLGPLWRRVRELAREDVVVPAALMATVMQAVRRERAGNGGSLPLRKVIPQLVDHAVLPGERGALEIADSVVAQIIQRETLATPGVLALDAAGVQSVLGRRPGVDVAVEESRVSARLRLVVELGWPIPDVLELVRRRAGAAVERMTGLRPEEIHITVTDVQGRLE